MEIITAPPARAAAARDRKSTRLNSSHLGISYAVFCLKKKKKKKINTHTIYTSEADAERESLLTMARAHPLHSRPSSVSCFFFVFFFFFFLNKRAPPKFPPFPPPPPLRSPHKTSPPSRARVSQSPHGGNLSK